MKSRMIRMLLFLSILCSVCYARGGAGPCLATCFLGDTRIGLYMNEGEPIEDMDWIRFAGSFVPYVGFLVPIYTSYKEAYPSAGATGCLVAYLWGHRAGREFTKYRLRTKEVLLCIPIVNIYPCVALPLEAYSGKTMSEVIEQEGLAR